MPESPRPAESGQANTVSRPSEVVNLVATAVRDEIVAAVLAGDVERARQLGDRLAQLEAAVAQAKSEASGVLRRASRA